jgi:hypothetical protein
MLCVLLDNICLYLRKREVTWYRQRQRLDRLLKKVKNFRLQKFTVYQNVFSKDSVCSQEVNTQNERLVSVQNCLLNLFLTVCRATIE